MNLVRLVREYQQLRRHPRSGLSPVAIILIIAGVVFLALLLVIGILVALMLPAVSSARDAARRTQSRNNLKQIGLAMHNYHDVHRQWAPGGIYEEGSDKGRHGWMTSILPYMEQQYLYDQVDFNEYWDSPANAGIFNTAIPVYHTPEYEADATTLFTANGFATAHYAGNSQVLLNNGNRQIRHMTDGTSNTVLAAQVGGSFMAWGDPENRRSFANGLGTGPNQFGSVDGQTLQVLMSDGSVRTVSYNVDPQVLTAIGTPDGGEVVGEF